MSNVQITITQTQDFEAPPGTVFAGYTYSLINKATSAVYTQTNSTDLSYTFDNVPEGDYIAQVQAIDTTGNAQGAAIQGLVTVPAPNVTIKAPATITVVLA